MTARHPMIEQAAAARSGTALTVLFADICGSTRLYAALGDEAARAVVAGGLDAVVAGLPRFGGRLVKTLGDEVMCVFPDPDCAIAAAAEMQVRVRAARPGGLELSIHVGLQHGPVLLEGEDVFGDTVNAASYLCAVATAGQILTAEATVERLSEAGRAQTRRLFYAIIKGARCESALYQILWEGDTGALTDVNFRQHNRLPPDSGSILLAYEGQELRIHARCPTLILGRDASCDMAVPDPFASRKHATLTLRRTQVFLADHSVNGTFVRRADGSTVHVFRSELLLEGSGEISLGRAFDQAGAAPIRYRRDRRALYRV
jgi:class 3 adenylate cyclase